MRISNYHASIRWDWPDQPVIFTGQGRILENDADKALFRRKITPLLALVVRQLQELAHGIAPAE